MKKNLLFLLIVFTIISLISCDTLVKKTIRVSVDRDPALTIENQTGYPVVVTAPLSANINIGARTLFQPSESNRTIDVTYRIGQIPFTEQVIWSNADATVTLTGRPPTITVENQTGRPVTVTDPVRSDISNGARTHFLAPAINQPINISYQSGLMNLIEPVNMGNQDVTVTLTTGAPTLTIVNNTGSGNNVNIIQLRTPGSVAWVGGNIAIRDNEFYLTEGTAQTGVTTQVMANGERLDLWLGTLRLSGNAFDIRLQTSSGGIIFQKENVRITGDMTLTFTQSDRR